MAEENQEAKVEVTQETAREQPAPVEIKEEAKPEEKKELPAEQLVAVAKEESKEKPAEPSAPKKEKKRKVKTAEKTEKSGGQKEGAKAGKEKIAEEKEEAKEEKKASRFSELKIFGRWQTKDIVISDLGLRPYINLEPRIVPYVAGRTFGKQFWKSKKSIIERLICKLQVAGHKGKKHFRTSGTNTGKTASQYMLVKKTFEAIEAKTKKNPIEVFVKALEVGTPREGIATIEYGGVRYPKAADLSPQRRLDLILRWMTQQAFQQAYKGKKHVWDALAEEIIATANNDQSKSVCISRKIELERQAGASR